MNIFIDESGSFVNAKTTGSFNSIAAYVSPERDRRALQKILASLKQKTGAFVCAEIKLKQVSEEAYFEFLRELDRLSGVVFCIATDSGFNKLDEVAHHQAEQAKKIVAHKDKMVHEAARNELQALSDRVANLSQQLYVQLYCQVILIDAVIRDGVLYFVQRTPRNLGAFRWRIDQKNTTRTEYENAFQQVLSPLLQSISLHQPIPMLIGADYSAFSRFDFPADKKPTYLKDTYGFDIRENEASTDIGKIIRENLKFVDSKASHGVQIADLIASGLRRCLRGEFKNNKTAAMLLGRLMVKAKKESPPIQLLGFSKSEEVVGLVAAELIRIMSINARPMLAR